MKVVSPRASKRASKTKGTKKGPKVKVKEETTEDSLANLTSMQLTKDLLNKDPLKGFMQRAQHEFRVYIALENAWPRKRNNVIEKREVPEQMIEMTSAKYEAYQGKAFKKLLRKVWADEKMHDLMVKQVSGRSLACSGPLRLATRHFQFVTDLQERRAAQAGRQAEGKACSREGFPSAAAAQG